MSKAMTHKACIFPGQGSQSVSMGKAFADNFPVAKETFQEVDDALNQKLSDIIFNGPEEELTLTQNTQPALMAVSMAIVRVIEKELNKSMNTLAHYVAGHSLGEYTALTAAGAFSVADCARLLRIRGNAMQEAVPVGQGGMAALIGVEFDEAVAITASVTAGVCQAANDNGGGQVVISGAAAAVEEAMQIATDKGVRRVVKLPVSAPFHSSLMEPAAAKMQEALAQVTINPPVVPLIANVSAQETSDPDIIRQQLVEQVTGTVRWRETIERLKGLGVEQTIEIGAGKVLTGLTKRIDREIEAISIQTPEDLELIS